MTDSDRVYLLDDPAIKQQLIDTTFASIPHTNSLGLEFVELEKNKATGRLPYRSNLVGNLENGAVHTGVLISLIDSIAGLAVLCALPEFEAFSTLDLRLDCFKPSSAHKTLFGTAECYRLTRTIAFVRGSIYHETPEDPIAGCVATFFRAGKQGQLLRQDQANP